MPNRQKPHNSRMTGIVSVWLVILLFFTACGLPQADRNGNGQNQLHEQNDGTHENEPGNSDPEDPQPLEPEPYTVDATLVAVGDIMMHQPQINAAYNPQTDSYSFDTYFTEVKPYLAGDWVVANLETPIAGKELRGYSGYPEFNAPEELADALVDAGFEIVSTANNHSLDRREQGVLNTLQNLRQRGLIPVGTHDSEEAAAEITVVEKAGISMAFLAYTYGTNGIPVPAGKPYLVNLIDEEKMVADIAKAREKADVVTISLHLGYEYHRQPNEEQKRLARQLIAAGADIILGSHPHVVQPYEYIETAGPDGVPRQGIVIYSLGNFISNQGPDQGTAMYTDVGVIFRLQVLKHFPEGTIELGAVETVPTWVHKYRDASGKRQYRVLPMEAVLAARADGKLTAAQYQMLEGYLREMQNHIPSMVQTNEK